LPAVNPSRKPGEGQSLHILFTRPPFVKDGQGAKPPFVRVWHSGLVEQNHAETLGATRAGAEAEYDRHVEKQPLGLLHPGSPVHLRNIWVGELKEPEGKPGGKKGPEGK